MCSGLSWFPGERVTDGCARKPEHVTVRLVVFAALTRWRDGLALLGFVCYRQRRRAKPEKMFKILSNFNF